MNGLFNAAYYDPDIRSRSNAGGLVSDGAPIITSGRVSWFREFADTPQGKYLISWGMDVPTLYRELGKDTRGSLTVNPGLQAQLMQIYDDALWNNVARNYANNPHQFRMICMTPKARSIDDWVFNEGIFQLYQKYIFMLVLIRFVETNMERPEFKGITNIEPTIEWVKVRHIENLPWLIAGPDRADQGLFDFKKHYDVLVTVGMSMDDIYQSTMISQAYSTGDTLRELNYYSRKRPNSFDKVSDEAKQFNVVVDSRDRVHIYMDTNNNLIFDCGMVSIKDTAPQLSQIRLDQMSSTPDHQTVEPLNTTTKLKKIFEAYNRIRIHELRIPSRSYITNLTGLDRLFVVFKGIACNPRVTSTTSTISDLTIGGKFRNTGRDYVFDSETAYVSYRPECIDVKDFKIYITTDPSAINKLTPAPFSIFCKKTDVYQHPFITGFNPEPLRHIKVTTVSNNRSTNPVEIAPSHDVDIKRIVEFRRYVGGDNSLLRVASLNLIKSIAEPGNPLLTDPLKYLIQYLEIEDEEINGISMDNIVKYLMLKPKTLDIPKNVQFPNFEGYTPLKVEPIWQNARMKSRFNISQLKNIYDGQTYLKLVDLLLNNTVIGNMAILFKPILNSIEFQNATTTEDFEYLFEIWNTAYSIMMQAITIIGENPGIIHDTKTITEERIIDTMVGTIDGLYFRVNEHNEFSFLDENGNIYITPDERYLLYPYDAEDLTLINMQIYSQNTTNPFVDMPYGSFMYSEFKSMIQNFENIILKTSPVDLTLKFDNHYIANVSNVWEEMFGIDKWNSIVDSENSMIYYRIDTTVGGITTTNYITFNDRTNTSTPSTPDEITLTNDSIIRNNIQPIVTTADGETVSQYIVKTGFQGFDMYYLYRNLQSIFNYNSEFYNIDIKLEDDSIVTNGNGNTMNGELVFSKDDIIGDVNNNEFILSNTIILSPDLIDVSYLKGRGIVRNKTFYGIGDENIIIATITSAVIEPSVDPNIYIATLTDIRLFETSAGILEGITITDMLGNNIVFKNGTVTSDVVISSTIPTVLINTSLIPNSNVRLTYSYNVTTMTLTILSEIIARTVPPIITSSTLTFKYDTKLLVIENKDAVGNISTSIITISPDGNNVISVNGEVTEEIIKPGSVEPMFSNAFKGYIIRNFPILAKYWNKTDYIYSLMNMMTPIRSRLIPVPENTPIIINSIQGSRMGIFTMSNQTESTIQLYGNYVILDDGIYEGIGQLQPSNLNMIYTVNNTIETYVGGTNTITVNTGETKILSYNLIYNTTPLRLDLIVTTSNIISANLYILSNDGYVLYGTWNHHVRSGNSIYIDDYLIIINFDKVIVSDTETIYNIINGNATRVNYESYLYVTGPDRKMYYQKMYTMKFSNIPGTIPPISTNYISLFLDEQSIFRYHHGFKYAENTIISPKQVTNDDYYLTILRYNSSFLIPETVYLRKEYNSTELPDDELSIATTIRARDVYQMVRTNPDMISISGIEKINNIELIAINTEKICVIPNELRLAMTLEFT